MQIRQRRAPGDGTTPAQAAPAQLGQPGLVQARLGWARRLGRYLIKRTGLRIIRESTYTRYVKEGGFLTGLRVGLDFRARITDHHERE